MSTQPDDKRGDDLEALLKEADRAQEVDRGANAWALDGYDAGEAYSAGKSDGRREMAAALRAALRGSEGESTREPVGCCARCGVACQFCGASEGTVARYAGDEMTAIRAKLAARSSEPETESAIRDRWEQDYEAHVNGPEGDGRT